MKKQARQIVIAAVAAAVVLSVVGCRTSTDDLDPPGPPAPTDSFVLVEGGTFRLGEALGAWAGTNNDVTPVSNVTVSSFWMSPHLVTQGEWYDVMGDRPSFFDGTNDWGGNTVSPEFNWRNLPVERVSWRDVLAYANLLSMAAGLTPAYEIDGSTDPADWGNVGAHWDSVSIVPGSTGYRLPTEAQWEFAAKGGNEPGDYTFSGSDDPLAVAWHSANSGSRTREVGGLAANALGLYDMSGNVWEWVWDWWGAYTSEDKTDPTGASSGSSRVIRGGSWHFSAVHALSVFRFYDSPSSRNFLLGFRLVRPLV